jgi:Mg2+/Co2+ transporter CorB
VDRDSLSSDELRTVVNEAGALISRRYQKMLISVLDLEKVTVDDIMVPRNEINGIDLDDPLSEIVEQLMNSQHTRLPVFRTDINNIVGILHLKKVLRFVNHGKVEIEDLIGSSQEPYFVPAGTPLSTQLRNFQRQNERLGLVVDEYGDIDGLVTLEDLLEEIVGEFTTDPADHSADVHPQPDGTFLVDGSANIRELNRSMHWDLPTDGPRTVNGLVLEHLETIPETGTSLLIAGYPVEIVQATSSSVKTARIKPALRRGARRRTHAG